MHYVVSSSSLVSSKRIFSLLGPGFQIDNRGAKESRGISTMEDFEIKLQNQRNKKFKSTLKPKTHKN